jgi:purine nucleoside phosphorylase
MSDGVILAVVAGTGLTEYDESAQPLALETPYGSPSAPIKVVGDSPRKLLFLPRHGNPHRYPPHSVNYRANMWALRELGATQVLAVSAVGGIHAPYSPGTLALPDQLIDYSWGREHSYCDSGEVPLVHVDFTSPYEGPLRRMLVTASHRAGLEVVDGGCIGVFQGPRLESAAEIERARRDGCDMAGMTSLPEAGLARELGLDYAGIAVVSNWGAGVKGRAISEDDIAETLREPMGRVRALLQTLMEML